MSFRQRSFCVFVCGHGSYAPDAATALHQTLEHIPHCPRACLRIPSKRERGEELISMAPPSHGDYASSWLSLFSLFDSVRTTGTTGNARPLYCITFSLRPLGSGCA